MSQISPFGDCAEYLCKGRPTFGAAMAFAYRLRACLVCWHFTWVTVAFSQPTQVGKLADGYQPGILTAAISLPLVRE